MKASDYVKQRSENLAGIISLGGSTLLFFSGDMKSATAAAIFTAAELTLAKAGDKSAGYSAGALMFAVGDLTLAFSDSVQDGSSLQMTLIGMSAAWGIGAMRYPTEKAAKYLNSERLRGFLILWPLLLVRETLSYVFRGLLLQRRQGKSW